MEVILGAGGVIGREIAKILHQQETPVRLVSRNPKKVSGKDELIAADLLNPTEVSKAVAGCNIAYLTAGLTYDIKVWQKSWPVIMENVIAACAEHHCKLVFFDNVYSYGLVKGKMVESREYHPDSKKGRVRAEIASRLMEAHDTGHLKALIARSADFYGPSADFGLPNILIFQNLAKGKSAQVLGDADKLHSYTFTRDAARGTVMLAHDDKAYGEVWHLPTQSPPLSSKEFVKMVGAEFGVAPKMTVLKKWLVSLIGIFNKPLSEIPEMMYQNSHDYWFDSTKFEERYNFHPTSYEEGIKLTAAEMKNQQ